jgi:hypothetical protein
VALAVDTLAAEVAQVVIELLRQHPVQTQHLNLLYLFMQELHTKLLLAQVQPVVRDLPTKTMVLTLFLAQ